MNGRPTMRAAALAFGVALCASPLADAADEATPAAPATLPNLTADLPTGQCNNGPGNEGADSFFSGTFSITGGTVKGTERWHLYANPKWKARGGKDCTLEWTFTGTVGSAGACAGCDTGIRFHAEPVLSGDCPEELVLGRLLPNGQRASGEGVPFDQSYGLKRKADGTLDVHFAKSGKLLGQGYHKGEAHSWVSAHQCKWF